MDTITSDRYPGFLAGRLEYGMAMFWQVKSRVGSMDTHSTHIMITTIISRLFLIARTMLSVDKVLTKLHEATLETPSRRTGATSRLHRQAPAILTEEF